MTLEEVADVCGDAALLAALDMPNAVLWYRVKTSSR